MKIPGEDASKQFIKLHFPTCEAAILAGSIIHGGATDSSDLDLVIFDESQPWPFRKTYKAFGWVIEAFVLTRSSYRYFFDEAIDCAIPSLLRMCSEGLVLHGSDSIEDIIAEARHDFKAGPPPLQQQELDLARYEISEALEDLLGCRNRKEGLFIVQKLTGQLPAFVLRANLQWIGDGKWMYRSLERYDPGLGNQLHHALEAYYRHDHKEPLVSLVQAWLAPFGGTLAEGFSQGEIGEDTDDAEDAAEQS